MRELAFIVGPYRSGTTLLRVLLCEHPQAWFSEETHAVLWLLQEMESGRSIESLASGLAKRLGSSPNWPADDARRVVERIRAAESQPACNPRGVIEALLISTVPESKRESVKVVGDNTPSYAAELPLLLAHLPEAKTIFMVRDPRDVVVSARKARMGGRSHLAIAMDWQRRVRAALLAREVHGPDRTTFVRYEDLVGSPLETMSSVQDALGLDQHPIALANVSSTTASRQARLAHHTNVNRPISTSSVGRYADELSVPEIRDVEGLLRDELDRFGYETRSADQGRPIPEVRLVAHRLSARVLARIDQWRP